MIARTAPTTRRDGTGGYPSPNLAMTRPLLYALLAAGAALAVAAPLALVARKPGWDARHERFTLPNGWRVTPAGRTIDLPGDMPGNILVLDGGKRALVNTCGYHDHSLNLVDLDGERSSRPSRSRKAGSVSPSGTTTSSSRRGKGRGCTGSLSTALNPRKT